MEDCREELLSQIKNAAISSGFTEEQIELLSKILILKIGNYEVLRRNTEVALIETESIQLLKYFLGTLHTEGKSKKTLNLYKGVIIDFYNIVDKPLLEVNAFDVRLYLSKIIERASKNTAENYRACLSSFYQFLLREEIISKNPMAKIKPVHFQKKKKKSFTEVELEKLRASCSTLRQRAELEFMLSSGVRVSELCDMTIADVDMTKKEVTVQHGKGDKKRITYINDLTVYYLSQYLNGRQDGYLFENKYGEKLSVRAVENSVKKLGSLANIEDVHPHRFRIHFATTMYRKGMDICALQILMGHANVETTRSYIADDTKFLEHTYKRYA